MHHGIHQNFLEAPLIGAIPNRYLADWGRNEQTVLSGRLVPARSQRGHSQVGPGRTLLGVTGPAPLTWRVPPWQPALLFLIAAASAALNLYAHPSLAVRLLTIAVAVIAAVMGVLAIRMYFVVDEEGIGVRRLLRERSVEWDEFDSVAVVHRAFDSVTLRIVCRDGRYLDVPQSLLMPSRPTGKVRVNAQLGDLARQVTAYGESYRR